MSSPLLDQSHSRGGSLQFKIIKVNKLIQQFVLGQVFNVKRVISSGLKVLEPVVFQPHPNPFSYLAFFKMEKQRGSFYCIQLIIEVDIRCFSFISQVTAGTKSRLQRSQVHTLNLETLSDAFACCLVYFILQNYEKIKNK